MLFLNLCDYVEEKMSATKKDSPNENTPFLPTTIVRYEISPRKPGYPWMELYGALVAATSFLCCGIVQSYTSGAIYSLQTDVESHITLSHSDISYIASSPPLAALVGTLLVGPMMDKLGRKKTLTLLAVPFIIGWLTIGFAVNFTMIIIGRLVTGLGFGMARACAPVYVTETARPQHRGKLGYLPPIMSATGVLIGCLLGSYFNWKTMAIIMAFFPAALLLMSLFLPETPNWLVSQNQEDQALQALKKLRYRRGNQNDDELRLYKEIEEIRESIQSNSITAAEYDHKCERKGIFQLIQQPWVRRPAVIVFLLMVCQQFSGVSAIIFFMKIILDHGAASLQPSTSSTEGQPRPPPLHDHDLRPTIVGIVHIVAFFFTLPLVDRFGRRILLMVSGVSMAISHLGLAIYFSQLSGSVTHNATLLAAAPNTQPMDITVRRDLSHSLDEPVNNLTGAVVIAPLLTSPDSVSSVHTWLPLLCLCAYIASFSLASPVPFILMSEMFSTKIRASLSSAATLICALASFLVVFLFPYLMYGISPVFAFALFAIFSLQTTLIGYVIPETKGKSLAQIENLFKGPRDFRGKVTATIEVPECAILDVAVAEETQKQIGRKY